MIAVTVGGTVGTTKSKKGSIWFGSRLAATLKGGGRRFKLVGDRAAPK